MINQEINAQYWWHTRPFIFQIADDPGISRQTRQAARMWTFPYLTITEQTDVPRSVYGYLHERLTNIGFSMRVENKWIDNRRPV